MYDINSKYYDIENDRIFYCLLTGKTYRQIAQDYYLFDLNKVIYKVRKLCKKLSLRNRRQLAYFAVMNGLVDVNAIANPIRYQ